MFNYKNKNPEVKIKNIKENGFNLSAKNNMSIVIPFKYKFLEDFIIQKEKGFEPGSKNYVNSGSNLFIRISDLEDSSFCFSDTEKTIKLNKSYKNKILQKGDICYQTASNVGNVCIYNSNNNAHYNSHIYKLLLDKSMEYYILGILKSSYNKEQLLVKSSGSIEGIDNFREEFLLKTIIPLTEDKNIEKLVSIITQNIIDKEEQIKEKNTLIDYLIEKELNINFSNSNVSAKKNMFIKNGFRFSAGLYNKEYLDIYNSIINYKNGYFNINDKEIKVGGTPTDYYFNENAKYLWITSKTIKNRILTEKRYLNTKKTPNLNDNDVIFMIIGNLGSKYISYLYKKSLGEAFVNQNCTKINTGDLIKNIFILCFLSSDIGSKIISCIKSNGVISSINNSNVKQINIPKFAVEKQKEIAINYFNEVEKAENTLETYLENEKLRNKDLGIWQLNQEIFMLKEQLEEIVEKIVFNKNIEINNYIF